MHKSVEDKLKEFEKSKDLAQKIEILNKELEDLEIKDDKFISKNVNAIVDNYEINILYEHYNILYIASKKIIYIKPYTIIQGIEVYSKPERFLIGMTVNNKDVSDYDYFTIIRGCGINNELIEKVKKWYDDYLNE